MLRRRQSAKRTNSDSDAVSPLPRARGNDSELDEYINLGEEQEEEEEDLFDESADEEEDEEEESTPIPRIERDTQMEEEIEQEKYVPLEKLIEDVPELSQSLDPVRM
ncbi:MAG: hypothetical protein WDZ49_00365 [Litorilinea sp.]